MKNDLSFHNLSVEGPIKWNWTGHSGGYWQQAELCTELVQAEQWWWWWWRWWSCTCCLCFIVACVCSLYVVFLHACDTGTVILRLAVFPLFIYIQKQMILMNNHMPTIQDMQEKFNKARRSGDILEGKLAVAVMSILWCYCRHHWLYTISLPYLSFLNPVVCQQNLCFGEMLEQVRSGTGHYIEKLQNVTNICCG